MDQDEEPPTEPGHDYAWWIAWIAIAVLAVVGAVSVWSGLRASATQRTKETAVSASGHSTTPLYITPE